MWKTIGKLTTESTHEIMSRSKFVFGVRDVIRFVMRKNRIPFLCTTYELAVDFCNNKKKTAGKEKRETQIPLGLCYVLLTDCFCNSSFSLSWILLLSWFRNGGSFACFGGVLFSRSHHSIFVPRFQFLLRRFTTMISLVPNRFSTEIVLTL